jgi:hypothetical protein
MKVFMGFIPGAMIRPTNRWGRARENDWSLNPRVITPVSGPPVRLGCAVIWGVGRISIFLRLTLLEV